MIASTGRLLISKQTQRHKERRSNSIGSDTFTGLTPSPSEGRWTVKEFHTKAQRCTNTVFVMQTNTQEYAMYFSLSHALFGSVQGCHSPNCSAPNWPMISTSGLTMACQRCPSHWDVVHPMAQGLERVTREKRSHSSTGGGSGLCGP